MTVMPSCTSADGVWINKKCEAVSFIYMKVVERPEQK